MNGKKFASAMSHEKDWRVALSEITKKLKKGLSNEPCDLAVCFVSETYEGFSALELSEEIRDKTGAKMLIGCNSSGVIGDGAELEMEPGISVLAMRLPGVRIVPFSLTAVELEQMKSGAELIGDFDFYPTEKPRFLVFADPMTCNIEKLLGIFNGAYPKCPVIGGLASGAVMRAPNWLMLGSEVVSEGAVGVAMLGAVDFDIVVAQGCRPIGKPFVVTKADGNVLEELAGRPAFIVLKELLASLKPNDQVIARHSLFAGLAMNQPHSVLQTGDFLVRNITGLEPKTGALVIGASLKVGQMLQFQLRDAATSSEDLDSRLSALPVETGERGVLVVSCCGRGRGLYGESNHDIKRIQAVCGPMPAAGFFANGEIGPVAGKNYVHGYTSSFAILR